MVKKRMTVAEMTEEQKRAYSYAIQDINNGNRTLWVERLKREDPELYNYAIEQRDKNG